MPNNKKKRNNNKKKAKQPSNGRSQDAASCGFCARLVADNTKVDCVCTRIVFCRESCREQAIASGKHRCPGPPSDQVVDAHQRLQELRASGVASMNLHDESSPHGRTFKAEHKRTVMDPMQSIIMMEFLHTRRRPENLTVRDYARYADKGPGYEAFAYHAGVHYKNRFLGDNSIGSNGHLVSTSRRGEEQQSVLETDALAFKYLKQAAEGGIGLAMQSLGECYEKGTGVRQNMLHCRDWLWHASLLKSVGAIEMLDSKITVSNEINATREMIEDMRARFYGQPMTTGGPNLASLFLALREGLAERNFTVPPFEGFKPTATVGNPPRAGSTKPVTIIGAEQLQASITALHNMTNDFTCQHGRRGTAKACTVQTYGEASRELDSPILVVPPAAACDERVYESQQLSSYVKMEKQAKFEVNCVHHESRVPLPASCSECLQAACERLAAVSVGAVALSEEEPLASRGRLAIWRDKSGRFKSETFKDYSRSENESALAAVVACLPELAHPLFVAQDPNFFWPLIQSHGCIRAALEYVAPHVDWNQKLGRVQEPPERVPLVADSEPSVYLRKCGNDLCLKLELDLADEGTHAKCAICQRRSYCSSECSKIDFPFHKRECRAASSGRTPDVAQPIPEPQQQQPPQEEQPIAAGEQVVVYGLKSKPKFNGLIGEISGSLTGQGRYPVKVPIQETALAIKPTNLFRLGVQCRAATSKKFAKFECSQHALALCSECCMDFELANRVSKLCFSAKQQGREIPREKELEHIGELHFATIARLDADVQHNVDSNYPLECSGLVDVDKKFVLKSIIAATEAPPPSGVSIEVAAAIVGLTCYGARTELYTRTLVPKHLELLVSMTYSHTTLSP